MDDGGIAVNDAIVYRLVGNRGWMNMILSIIVEIGVEVFRYKHNLVCIIMKTWD
jgi:hypothetical protein